MKTPATEHHRTPSPLDPAVRRRGNAARLTLVLAQAVLTAGTTLGAGCAPGDEEVGSEGQAVVTSKTGFDTEFDVGLGNVRPMHVSYRSFCKKYENEPSSKPGFPPTKRCVQFVRDDSPPWGGAKLYPDRWALENDSNGAPMRAYPAARSCGTACVRYETVPAYKPGGPARKICVQTRDNVCHNPPYMGCGPAAAANVLYFYTGAQPGTADIANNWVDVWGVPLPDGNIATTPDSLADGLRELLKWNADGNFKVTRRSGVVVEQEIKRAIDSGNPIIVLVNEGTHFVMVSGYRDGTAFLTDYVGNEREHGIAGLGFGTIGPKFLGKGAGYLPNTVITIERQPGWSNGLYKAADHAGVYRLNNGKACALSWPQFVAMGQPGYTILGSDEGRRQRSVFGLTPGPSCSNAEAGTFTDGLYKSSDAPAVYSLKGQRACLMNWNQYVALRQPPIQTLDPTQAGRLLAGFFGGTACTNAELGI